jgi:hypothetical protein
VRSLINIVLEIYGVEVNQWELVEIFTVIGLYVLSLLNLYAFYINYIAANPDYINCLVVFISHQPQIVIYRFISTASFSGSIASDYGLDDRAIGVRFPAGAKDFSSILCVQTGSGAHPAPCTMGTGGPFPGGKARPGRDADHSLPYSAEVVNE